MNFLRNIALNQVHTPLVFLSDIDFVPMPGLYSYLRYIVLSFLVICGVELDVNKILIYLWLNEAKCNEIDDKWFHEFPRKMV